MFYTYVLKSLKDNNLYIGYSEDLKKRLFQHNKGLVGVTKPRRPFKLVYYEVCLDKGKALQREKALKTGFGRAYLKRRI
ncbi:MAG: GIY-YIG nuclease family protein [Candidatus Paceibacterota bacterium]